MDGGAVPVAGFEQAMHELLAGGRERGAGIDGGLIVLHRLLAASGCAHDVREIVVRRRAARIGLQRALQPFDAFPGLVLLEQNDEWAVQRSRYMTLFSGALLSDDPLVSLPAVAR